jgi:hypothetical protein
VRADGDRIRVADPQRVLTDALRDAIRAHRQALLGRLAVQPAPSGELPSGLQTIRGADGQMYTVVIYRCPVCQGTAWGPRLDEPSVWCCLTCADLRQRGPCDAQEHSAA